MARREFYGPAARRAPKRARRRAGGFLHGPLACDRFPPLMEPVERQPPFLPVLLAWLVPGAGHLKIGRLWPGVFTFAAIIPLYVAGMALAGFENVSWERHPFFFWGAHIWGGLLTAGSAALTRHAEVRDVLPDQSVGMLFTAVACLLNVVAMADVWSRCGRGDPEARAAARAAAAEEAARAAHVPPPEVPAPSTSPAPEAPGG